MRKYIKRGVIGLAIALAVVGSIILYSKLDSYFAETKTPEVKKTMEEIVEKNKADIETINMDMSKISNEDIYNQIHQMANTLIVAEDGMIRGEIKIDKKNISLAMYMVKESNTLPEKEKEVFLNVLQDWSDGNFSSGVQAHNYAWNKLGGDVGRAKDIRPQYK